MGIDISELGKEVHALEDHEEAVREKLNSSTSIPARQALRLVNDFDRTEDELGRAQLKELDAEIASLDGKSDLDSLDKRATLHSTRLFIEERRAVTLDARAALASERARLKPELDAAQARQDVELEKTVHANRARSMEAAIHDAPWVRSLVPSSPIAPNACPTCANSATRFTAEALKRAKEKLTPAMARLNVARRYPELKLKPTPEASILEANELAARCGPHSAACAWPPTDEVFLSDTAQAEIVQHEVDHALSSDAWFKRVPDTVNEGVTEYFARHLGYFPEDGFSGKAYEGLQPVLDVWIREKPERELALAKAYFTGDFSDLERLDSNWSSMGVHGESGGPLDKRFADWHNLLRNKLPGSDVTFDDEEVREAAQHAADIGDWGMDPRE